MASMFRRAISLKTFPERGYREQIMQSRVRALTTYTIQPARRISVYLGSRLSLIVMKLARCVHNDQVLCSLRHLQGSVLRGIDFGISTRPFLSFLQRIKEWNGWSVVGLQGFDLQTFGLGASGRFGGTTRICFMGAPENPWLHPSYNASLPFPQRIEEWNGWLYCCVHLFFSLSPEYCLTDYSRSLLILAYI